MIVDEGANPLLVFAQADQTGRVMRESIVTVVQFGDDDADHLSFDARNS